MLSKQRLSEAECDRLEEALKEFPERGGMNLEMVDGFFAALLCGPDLVTPGEFIPEILSEAADDQDDFSSLEEAGVVIDLLMRHWNAVEKQLRIEKYFTPLLATDESGACLGNDWAYGFIRGMDMRKPDWVAFMDDEEHCGPLIPIFILAHEHDPDPKMRPYKKPVTDEQRQKLFAGLSIYVPMIHRHFAPQRENRTRMDREQATHRREAPKIQRNAPCYCGSGRKYKKCCGSITVH